MANNKYNNNFEKSDIDFIKSNYQKMSIKEISDKLGKCQSGIYKTIASLGLEFSNREGKPWNDEEVKYLKDNYLKKVMKK